MASQPLDDADAGLFAGPVCDPNFTASSRPHHSSGIPMDDRPRTKVSKPKSILNPTVARPLMKMTQASYQTVMQDLTQRPFRHEQGGLLLGPEDSQDLVTRYVKDEWGHARPASFTINSDRLNEEIRNAKQAGLTAVGIIHSHPDGICRPSYGDLEFLQSIFSNPKNVGGYFLFPIVCGGRLYPFVVETTDVRRIHIAELVLV